VAARPLPTPAQQPSVPVLGYLAAVSCAPENQLDRLPERC
jgi:hypothetical protein